MQRLFKNLEYAAPLPLAAQVECRPGQIASKTPVQNPAVGLTLFAFDAGEEISSHTSTGDALVQVLEGALEVTIAGTTQPVRAGEVIVMPAGQPHAVRALERSAMLLTVIFAPEAGK